MHSLTIAIASELSFIILDISIWMFFVIPINFSMWIVYCICFSCPTSISTKTYLFFTAYLNSTYIDQNH